MPRTGALCSATISRPNASDSSRGSADHLEGMLQIGLPIKVIDVVMTWQQQAQYSINHDESTRKIEATKGFVKDAR